MVCHLGDWHRMFMGEKIVRSAPQKLPRVLVKWIALWVPIPWPKGFQAAPELDQKIGGTPPVQFEADMRELCNLIERFTRRPTHVPGRLHPHMGTLSENECLRLGYLHADHHLRQFGA
jgi:Protein of unknown function (DUF1569)